MIIEIYDQMMAEGFADSVKCRNKCIIASVRALTLLGIPDGRHNLYMRHGEVHGEEHHWINIDGVNYDFTARQYAKNASFPLVWKSPKHLYANDKPSQCVYCGATLYTSLPVANCSIMHLECIMAATEHIRPKQESIKG